MCSYNIQGYIYICFKLTSAHATVGALVNVDAGHVRSIAYETHVALAPVAPPSVDAVLGVFLARLHHALVDVPAVSPYLLGVEYCKLGERL